MSRAAIEAIRFPGPTSAEPARVGGKGASLLGLAAAGVPVPEGAVLPTGFFAPWFDEVRRSPAWAELVVDDDEFDARCETIKTEARALALSDEQRAVLDGLRADVEGWGLAAVRSSSPEEDLASASFAGGYETVLGVTPASLEEAVRACFVSALDARVLRYKAAHGFDPLEPSIAVVIQRQLDSEIAGVGFSLDPLDNDYDEVVIDAAWGLGETVVAGLTEPDHVVVVTPSLEILEYRVGAKLISQWLHGDGGTETRRGFRSGERCLDRERIVELTATIRKVEAWLGRPVDIEWAVADGALHVLQARPITTWLPFPPELQTAPGERRRLYMDASLSNGLSLNEPVSPLGLDWLVEIFTQLLERFVGPIDRSTPPEEAVYIGVGGRLYANLSDLFWTQSPRAFARSQASVDALLAETVQSVDVRRYRSRRWPPFLAPSAILRLPRLVWSAAPLVLRILRVLLAPEASRRRYDADLAAGEALLRTEIDGSATVREVMQRGFDDLIGTSFVAIWSALGAYGVGLAVTKTLAPPIDERLAMRLEQGFQGNVVVEMGAALLALAERLEPDDFDDLDQLVAKTKARDLPRSFLDAWDAFHDRFGHRGPVEMDLARPRYRDDPRLALTQMASLRRADVDLEALHAERIAARRAALQQILARSGALRRWLLRWADRLLETYAGERDTPKFHLTLYNERVRRRALQLGRALVQDGRLDAPEHVFDLHLDEIDAALDDRALDLRARRRDNVAFLEPLRRRSLTFPPVIDSRGRIIRPPLGDVEPGELRGMGVSPGVATGRVRRLERAEDAVVEPGDVLVAYTTDPGWTPLFVHVAAVVLEIGGALQHGALVAREYGKPCVVGISRVLERLEDGQRVEVDGFTGRVRILDD